MPTYRTTAHPFISDIKVYRYTRNHAHSCLLAYVEPRPLIDCLLYEIDQGQFLLLNHAHLYREYVILLQVWCIRYAQSHTYLQETYHSCLLLLLSFANFIRGIMPTDKSRLATPLFSLCHWVGRKKGSGTVRIPHSSWHSSDNEPYPQLRHNEKMAKSVGGFCTEGHWEETKSRP